MIKSKKSNLQKLNILKWHYLFENPDASFTTKKSVYLSHLLKI